ncbi:MAG TPA: serine/threonine-protein kinase, partial [Verrucomicrobiae bacterium]|nr:serine/threonine-protein kinase [Verrucomicrobiae bacterium]
MPAPEMSSERKREEAIFESALELPGPERANYLDRSCQNQPAVRARIQRLLQSHADAGFMRGGADPSILASLEAELGGLGPDECGANIGSYKLVEKIGEGGCGIVYRAEQESPIRRSVALKVIKFGTDTKSVIARFQQERQALAMMDHPNIARVFEAGATEKGRPFFVMELVRGVKITTYCDEHRLSTVQRLDLFLEVCLAIQHAHQKGIIHRDIKPSNILVTLNDGAPTPKVIDFGIAKATSGERLTEQTLFTAFAHFIGTPAYMSPEQAEMSTVDVDTRSDIYSLGILLYELLTGRPPFDGEALLSSGLDAMRKTIRETEPTRPSLVLRTTPTSNLNPPLPSSPLDSDLDWIVLKCLEKDRSRRYQSASDLAGDIERYLMSEPIAARPPSTTYKIQKAWRRNKLAFSAAAAVITALLLGTAVSTWQAFEARRERLTAQKQRDAARVAQSKAEQSERAREKALHEAQHYLYVANINLAGRAWEQDSYQGVRQRLEETRDFPARGFEWYYWQRQAHLELKVLRGHAAAVRGIAFSPDGQRLVTSGHDATVRIWSVPDGRLLLALNGSSPVNSVVFSRNGRLIASANDDGTVRFWNSITGDQWPSLSS